MIKQTIAEWEKEAVNKFGKDKRKWAFVCPKCGNVQTARTFMDNNVEANGRFYFSCIGRWVDGIGCNWTAGGLFGTMGKGRVIVDEEGQEHEIFDFAEIGGDEK